MPPLRDRKVDIPLLAAAFLRESAAENGKPFRDLTSEAMTCIIDFDWPGNVRELRTAIEHGVVMSTADKIGARDLPASVRGGAIGPSPTSQPERLNLHETETVLILRALDDTSGNRSEAAIKLGISRRTLQRRIKELNLQKRSRKES